MQHTMPRTATMKNLLSRVCVRQVHAICAMWHPQQIISATADTLCAPNLTPPLAQFRSRCLSWHNRAFLRALVAILIHCYIAYDFDPGNTAASPLPWRMSPPVLATLDDLSVDVACVVDMVRAADGACDLTTALTFYKKTSRLYSISPRRMAVNCSLP